MKTELEKLLAEQRAWNRTYLEIMRALKGDPVAIAENHKQVERLRLEERDQ